MTVLLLFIIQRHEMFTRSMVYLHLTMKHMMKTIMSRLMRPPFPIRQVGKCYIVIGSNKCWLYLLYLCQMVVSPAFWFTITLGMRHHLYSCSMIFFIMHFCTEYKWKLYIHIKVAWDILFSSTLKISVPNHY